MWTLCTYFNIEFSFSWKIKRHEFIHWKFYPAWCFCDFEFALRNILTFKLNFWVQIYFLCFVWLSSTEKKEWIQSWMWLLATSYASRTRPDKNYVQIQKTAFHLGYMTKLNDLYQAEQTDDFYTPSSVWKPPISYNAYNFTQCFDNYQSLKLDSNVVKNITTMFKKSLDPFRIIWVTQTDWNCQTLHYSLFKRRSSLRSQSRKIKLLRHKIQSSIHSFHFSARSFWKRFREVLGNLRSFCYSSRFKAQKAKFRLKFT